MLLTPKAVNQMPTTGDAASRKKVQADSVSGGEKAPEMMLFPYIREPANRQRRMAVALEEVKERVNPPPTMW